MALLHSWAYTGTNFETRGSAELVIRIISYPSNISIHRLCERVEKTKDLMHKRKFAVHMNGGVALISCETADEFSPLNESCCDM
jgi:hypothetical protein